MFLILKEIINRTKNNETLALVTIVDTEGSTPGLVGSKMLINLQGRIIGTIGGGILEGKVVDLSKEAIKNNQSELLMYSLDQDEASLGAEAACGGEVTVFIDVIKPQEKIVIFGAGHIAFHFSKLAKMIGFEVTIVDERKEFANKERFPDVDEIIVLEPNEALAKIEEISPSYIVIITRDHSNDEEALLSVINQPLKYIGMIGSLKKNRLIFQNLLEKGVPREKINEVFAPIGLDIGAKTPEEIAISIIAEIIQVKSGKAQKKKKVAF